MPKHLILLACCAVSFGMGLALRKTPPVVEKTVFVTIREPVFQNVPQGAYFGMQRDKIAAVIPASALRLPGGIIKKGK